MDFNVLSQMIFYQSLIDQSNESFTNDPSDFDHLDMAENLIWTKEI